LQLATETLQRLPRPLALAEFSDALLDGVQRYRGVRGELEDDITLLTLRRAS